MVDEERQLWGAYGVTARRLSHRQLRLYGCGCCRAVWDRLTDGRSRSAVEVVERYADRQATAAEMAEAERDAGVAELLLGGHLGGTGRSPARLRRSFFAAQAAHLMTNHPGAADEGIIHVIQDTPFNALSGLLQAGADRRRTSVVFLNILGDIARSVLRPVPFDPAWQTPTSVALADAIYAGRAFDRLPVLADALEEAGCDNADVLAHCRGDGPHVRGCWVVDLVLGKS